MGTSPAFGGLTHRTVWWTHFAAGTDSACPGQRAAPRLASMHQGKRQDTRPAPTSGAVGLLSGSSMHRVVAIQIQAHRKPQGLLFVDAHTGSVSPGSHTALWWVSGSPPCSITWVYTDLGCSNIFDSARTFARSPPGGGLTGASPSGCTHQARDFASLLRVTHGDKLRCCCWGVPGHLVLDSGLDAFSQYPSHGSFATPASRLIAETRGAA